MIGHQVPAAFGAILPLADLGLLEYGDMLGPGGYPNGLRLPKSEGVHRSAGPRTARTAMTIAHGFRFTGNFDMNCPAKTLPFVRRRHRCLLLVGTFGSCCRASEFLATPEAGCGTN
jgi:hypothetical protein